MVDVGDVANTNTEPRTHTGLNIMHMISRQFEFFVYALLEVSLVLCRQYYLIAFYMLSNHIGYNEIAIIYPVQVLTTFHI